MRADGTVAGFGENASGAAGGTPGSAVASPTTIAGLSGVTAVAAGGAPYAGGGLSLALKADGTVWAWGRANALGSTSAVAGGDSGTPRAVALPAGARAIAIAAGATHGLAALDDGSVWGWGNDEYGELGQGAATTNRDVPVQVIAAAAAGAPKVVAVTAGDSDSYALYDDGSYTAWGYDGYGNLGLGSGSDADVLTPTAPVAKAARPANYPPFTRIVATGGTTYAIAAATGQVFAWGRQHQKPARLPDEIAGIPVRLPVHRRARRDRRLAEPDRGAAASGAAEGRLVHRRRHVREPADRRDRAHAQSGRRRPARLLLQPGRQRHGAEDDRLPLDGDPSSIVESGSAARTRRIS